METSKFTNVLKEMETESAEVKLTLSNTKEFEGKVHRIDEDNLILEFQSGGNRVYIDMDALISIEVR